MRQVKVHSDIVNQEFTGWLIEEFDDMKEMVTVLNNATRRIIDTTLSSKIDINKFDHLRFGGIADVISIVANTRAQMIGTNPLWELPQASKVYVDGLLKMLDSGETVIINSNGGYQALSDRVRIVEDYGHKPFFSDADVKINNSTKILILENDTKLEEEAVRFAEKLDKNYSYITQLRTLDEYALEGKISEFKYKGGHTVYIYTTGLDVKQMYFYSEVVLKYLNKFIFHFSAPVSKEVEEFIEQLKQKAEVGTIYE